MNNKVLYDLSYGVYITTAVDDGRPVGCVTNSVMQITSSPATIAVSVNHDNYTNACIRKSGRFSISILTEDSDPALICSFGFHISRDTDKFKDIRFEMQDGLPIIQDASGFIICKLIDTMETATHTIFLGEITAMEAIRPGTPMTYSYYHKVIKGKSPKNAPTYQPQEEADAGSSIRWKCMICGYIYEGDPLPEGFKCPICGVGADMFEKIIT